MNPGPAFYARSGSRTADVLTMLHLPYTLWHLSYVVLGAALAARLDWGRLAATLVAFLLGLGVGAHALDEAHDRPLGTSLSRSALFALGIGGLVAAVAIGVMGAFAISPWVLVWAAAGVSLAAGYSLEWSRILHSDWGFATAWGGFPVLVGYWAQAEALSLAAIIATLAAIMLSRVQRALSTPARRLRRDREVLGMPAGTDAMGLLETWEVPLRLLAVAVPLVSLGVLATHF